MFGTLLRGVSNSIASRLPKSHSGSWLGLPDLGYTEDIAKIINKPRTDQGGSNLIASSRQGSSASSNSFSPTPTTQGNYNVPIPGGFNPSSGGQPSGSGSSGGQVLGTYSGGSDGAVDPSSEAYAAMRAAIEAGMQPLDQSYNTAKSDLEAKLGRAKETLGERTGDIERGFGEGLRNLIQSDRELGQKSRNIYSALNALDSSSFAENNEKARQSFLDTQSKLELERERQKRGAEREYGDYESSVNSALAGLASQYMGDKQNLQLAIAENRIQEASDIWNRMQQMQAQAFNLAQLQAQGVDVVGNLQKFGRAGLDSVLGNYMGNTYSPMIGRLQTPTRSFEGQQGYISPRTGKKYSSFEEFQRAEG